MNLLKKDSPEQFHQSLEDNQICLGNGMSHHSEPLSSRNYSPYYLRKINNLHELFAGSGAIL
jgi:hypothetical protein